MMNKFLLRRKIRKIATRSERERVYQNLKEIRSVMVLFDAKNFEEANLFIQHLKKMGKRIKVFAYKTPKDIYAYQDKSFSIVYKDNMQDMKGESLTQIVNSLSKEKFDLVVDLTLEENLLLLYILVSTNSLLKVGFHKHTPWVHDIVISLAPGAEQNVKELGDQVIYYLSAISSEGTKKG